MTAREWTKDVYKGVGLFVSSNYKVLVHNYVFVTLGSCVVLALLYATNTVIKQIKIEFPASVALMLLLYVFLLVSQSVLGHARTSMIVKYVEIPANFALKWINMFFIPAFVTLPLADKISVKEAFIIGAVFVVGYVAMFVAIAYLVKLVQIITGNKSGRDLEPSDTAPASGAQSVSELSVEEIALDTVAAHLDYPAPTAAVAADNLLTQLNPRIFQNSKTVNVTATKKRYEKRNERKNEKSEIKNEKRRNQKIKKNKNNAIHVVMSAADAILDSQKIFKYFSFPTPKHT